ncbi:hypothetical protein ES703_45891 [subsurface metagenome]
MPVGKGVLGREPIKAIIEFYGIKMAGVKFEPSCLGQFRRIEDVAPVVVMPAGGANMVVKRHYRSCLTSF